MNLIVRVLLVFVAASMVQFGALAQRLPPDPGRPLTPPPQPEGPGIAKDGKTPPRDFAPATEEKKEEDGKPASEFGNEEPNPMAPPGEEGPKNTVEATAPANIIKISSTGVTELSCHKLGLNDMVSLDFKEMPLDDLIRLMSCWTDKNFLLTQGFQGKTITLMSPQPVTVAEAYKAFLSVLRAHQLTVAPSGKFLRIVPENTVKQEPIPFLRDDAGVPADERMVTKIVKLHFVPASELSQILGSFKGKAGEIITYGEDTLIITDAAVMVRNLLKFIDELDRPTDKEKYWIRPVQYAEATELIDIIQSMFGEDSGGTTKKRTAGRAAAKRSNRKGQTASAPAGPSSVNKEGGEEIKVTKVLADERTNQLLIVANSATYMQVDKLLRKVDVPIPGEGQIHIYYLENADADELSSTLSSLASGSSSGRASPRGGASPRAGAGGSAGGGGVAGLFEGEVKITSHQQTNSLIIEASLKDYLSLKKVVEKLDIRRKQVYVEAIIMEITSNKERKFGISGSAGTTFDIDGETVPLLMGLGGLGVSGLDMSQLLKGGLATGLQGPLVDVSTGSTGAASGVSGDLSIPSFGFLIQAIASNSDVNILSTPHILTTDNEEAEIQVGKQIPYQASSMGGLGGLGGLSSMAGLAGLGGTRGGSSALGGLGGLGGMSSMLGGLGGGMVQRIDVDLTLKITPHVNESNYVRLEIDQSIDDVESIDRELGPTTSKRRVKNTVVVRDQQPVVIGGLIRETESEGIDKLPFLGDIPLIGILFRKTVTKTEKKNLLMVIVPHIIDDPSDLARIHQERTAEIKRFAEYLATDGAETEGSVDYEKKNGALEHMRRVVDGARAERNAKERAEFEGTAVDLVGPPESHELEFDPTKQPESENQ